MSFPKAKIKRFNDIQATTPSPADYNVNVIQKAKLGFIPQQERFMDCKSPPPSETGSTQSTPCFRTPKLLKKRTAVGSASRPKLQSLRLSDRELLNEKTVECKNKDMFIKELTEQLEDLKNKLYDIECEKEAVSLEKEKFKREISEWTEAHNVEINILSEKYEAEISDLNNKISTVEYDLKMLEGEHRLFKEGVKKLDEIKQQEISEYEKEICAKNAAIEQTQKTLKIMQEDKKIMEESHKNEIELIKDKHLAELQSIEVKMLKNIHEMQMTLDEQKLQSQLKVKELEDAFQNEIKTLKHTFNKENELINSQNITCIAQLEEKMNEIKLISEIQCAEKCSELENYWKNKLENKEKESNEILKECQAISEYNIIESEIEKNKYKSMFEENSTKYNVLEKKYDDVYLKYKKLQSSFSEVQNKLYRLMKEIREKNALSNQLDELILEQQKYQTTISRSQQTIDILTNRLKESDADVEQLKNEIYNNERKILEFEHKVNLMSDELKEALAINEALEMKTESNLRITQEEISKVMGDLLAKVEKYKVISEKNRVVHEKELKSFKEEREELLQMLEQHQILNLGSKDLLTKADQEIERLTMKSSEYNEQIEFLQGRNVDLNNKLNDMVGKESCWIIEKKELDLKVDILKNELREMRKREEEWQQCCHKINEMERDIDNHKEKLSEKDARIKELEIEVKTINSKYVNLEEKNRRHLKIIEDQNALIAPFKEQLESFELEMKNMKSAKDHIENNAKDLGQKYAEILGHQNHKQKIKYMLNLKTKNEELSKTNIDLESKLRIQEKKFEKLKKENADLKRTKKITIYEDKENIGSPNRSYKCDSPGPLKNLN